MTETEKLNLTIEYSKVALGGMLAQDRLVSYNTAHQAWSMAKLMVEVMDQHIDHGNK